MALIICPECGRQISDKAEYCVGCGYPIKEMVVDNRSEIEKLVDLVWKKYPYSKTKAVIELQNKRIDLKTAKSLMDAKFSSIEAKEVLRQKKISEKEESRKNLENIRNACIGIQDAFGGSKVAKCPKCRSTSISYQNKVSIGRAIIGGALAGSEGAVLGALTGKKGYAVCLNCGKRWKV